MNIDLMKEFEERTWLYCYLMENNKEFWDSLKDILKNNGTNDSGEKDFTVVIEISLNGVKIKGQDFISYLNTFMEEGTKDLDERKKNIDDQVEKRAMALIQERLDLLDEKITDFKKSVKER